MIIDNAAIKMLGRHQQQQLSQREESLRIRHPDRRSGESRRPAGEQLTLSRAGQAKQANQSGGTKALDTEKPVESKDSLMMQIIRRMVKEITGRDLKTFSPDQLAAGAEQPTYQDQQPAPAAPADNGGLTYQQTLSYFESETTSFSAEGTINTRDGQSLSFSLSLNMSRSFYAEVSNTIQIGETQKKDPLVINFEGMAAELTSSSFQFDIDADGAPDQIAGLKSGSGLLALDKNSDGSVNDGSELFGALTGNGFAELANYDQDGNQFIDAADAIYQKLRIWQRHADGSQQLLALGAKNIGAIYLGHLTTPFQLKDEQNQSRAEIASSGFYLTEQGQAGSVQQLNFMV